MINSYRNQGQGLIESLIVILFVAVSVVGILRLQNYLNYNTKFAQQKSDATLLANKQLEILHDFSVLNTTASYTAYQDITSGSSTSTVSGTTYTVTWTTTTNTTPAYKNLNISVSWTDNYGTSQSISLIDNVANVDPALSNSFM